MPTGSVVSPGGDEDASLVGAETVIIRRRACRPTGPLPPPQPAPCLRRKRRSRRSGHVVLVLGLPAASASAGLAAYASTMRTVHARSEQRHRIIAQVTSAPEEAPGSAADGKRKVQVGWTGKDGRPQTGTARVPLDRTAGSVVRIRVDREGTVQGPPMSAGNATPPAG